MPSENAVNVFQQPWQFASGFVAFTVVVAIIGGAISVHSVILFILFYWWYFRGRLKVDEGNGRNRDELWRHWRVGCQYILSLLDS